MPKRCACASNRPHPGPLMRTCAAPVRVRVATGSIYGPRCRGLTLPAPQKRASRLRAAPIWLSSAAPVRQNSPRPGSRAPWASKILSRLRAVAVPPRSAAPVRQNSPRPGAAPEAAPALENGLLACAPCSFGSKVLRLCVRTALGARPGPEIAFSPARRARFAPKCCACASK